MYLIRLSFLLLIPLLALQTTRPQDTKIITVDTKIGSDNELLDLFDLESYIRLETAEESMIEYIYYIERYKDRIYIQSNRCCLVYDLNGKFIGKVYNVGRGPGEIIKPMGFSLDHSNGEMAFFDNLGRALCIYSNIQQRKRKIQPGELNYIDDVYCLGNEKYLLKTYLPQDIGKKKNIKSY